MSFSHVKFSFFFRESVIRLPEPQKKYARLTKNLKIWELGRSRLLFREGPEFPDPGMLTT